jgi:Bax protein
VFGQRTFRKGAGLVPLRREQGLRHEVKSFNSLYTSVRAYVWNLNTHFAYEKFRAKRAAFRDGGQPLDSYALTRTLERYSERGHKYIKTIQVIMRANRLHDFDDVELLPETGRRQPS